MSNGLVCVLLLTLALLLLLLLFSTKSWQSAEDTGERTEGVGMRHGSWVTTGRAYER